MQSTQAGLPLGALLVITIFLISYSRFLYLLDYIGADYIEIGSTIVETVKKSPWISEILFWKLLSSWLLRLYI